MSSLRAFVTGVCVGGALSLSVLSCLFVLFVGVWACVLCFAQSILLCVLWTLFLCLSLSLSRSLLCLCWSFFISLLLQLSRACMLRKTITFPTWKGMWVQCWINSKGLKRTTKRVMQTLMAMANSDELYLYVCVSYVCCIELYIHALTFLMYIMW